MFSYNAERRFRRIILVVWAATRLRLLLKQRKKRLTGIRLSNTPKLLMHYRNAPEYDSQRSIQNMSGSIPTSPRLSSASSFTFEATDPALASPIASSRNATLDRRKRLSANKTMDESNVNSTAPAIEARQRRPSRHSQTTMNIQKSTVVNIDTDPSDALNHRQRNSQKNSTEDGSVSQRRRSIDQSAKRNSTVASHSIAASRKKEIDKVGSLDKKPAPAGNRQRAPSTASESVPSGRRKNSANV